MSQATISQIETEHGQVIDIHGRVDHQITPDLEALLAKLMANGHHHLLVDLTAVNYINSGGLRCLVSAWRTTRREGGELTLCGLSGRLQELFQMVGFDQLFHIYPTRESALKRWAV